MHARTLGIVLLVAAAVCAQDKPEQAADKVLAAFQANDAKALQALAQKDNPDPWIVAHELCFRGEHDAAEAFAKAAPRKDTEKLPTYVASRRGKKPNPAAREALAAALEALAARNAKGAVVATEATDAKPVDVVSIKLLYLRGIALRSVRRLEESATTLLAAADGAERIGWLVFAASAYIHGGFSAFRRADWPVALQAWQRRLVLEQTRGKRGDMAGACINIGNIHNKTGAYPQALEFYEKGLKHAEAQGHRQWTANALNNIGMIHEKLGSYAKARRYQKRALQLKRELGDRVGVARTLSRVAELHRLVGEYAKAIEYYQRALAMQEQLGNQDGVTASLINLGVAYRDQGSYEKALAFCNRGLKQAEALGHREWAANALGALGNIHMNRGSYAQALVCQERSLKLMEALGNRAGVARAFLNIGNIHDGLGSWAQALDCYERALKMQEALANPADVAKALANIGLVHRRLGAFAKALDYAERSRKQNEELGAHAGVAAALADIGVVHEHLGLYAKALDYHKRALKMHEEGGDRAGIVRDLVNIGTLHSYRGESETAFDYHGRALKLAEEMGNRPAVASCLSNRGAFYFDRGSYAKALDCYERALQEFEELGAREGIAQVLGSIGTVHGRLGSHEKAVDYLERSLAKAIELGSLAVEVAVLWSLATIHVAVGKPREAVRVARAGVAKLPLLIGKLGEEQSASARDQWIGLLEVGVRAGMQIEDPSTVSFFIESGRAGSLLESLGGRKVLGTIIPEDLRREETAARAEALAAQARYGRALDAGKRTEIDASRKELGAAREKMLEAVAQIQRSAKAVADVAYPKAAPLATIQAALAPDEALVSYAILEGETVAFVVTHTDARVVELGAISKIDAALAAVAAGGGSGALTRGFTIPKKGLGSSAGFQVLRQKLIDALGLEPRTKRLLISPAGALSYLPFAVLVPDREVVYVPSGTTYTALREDRAKRGNQVLALGDIPKRRASIYGPALARLPGTRVEAKAVGDVVLLGTDATETRLAEALAKSERGWRSVHLACHGLVNAAQPQLSALALAPNAEEDGFLTVLEVFQAKIPADVVVLSACETAKGKVYQAEGIVGFARAFMLAGSPRVIVSLWPVEDEATRALMVKFYELWKPGKMATATALKKAQEFVRDHPKHPDWRKPYYWAAWQLWGLGD